MGLIASENTIQSELLQTTLAQKGVSAEKSKAILIELGLMNQQTGELLTQKACTKADLEAILAQKGITGAQAEGIISALGLSGANAGLTASFGLLGKAIWGVTKALLTNPITWIVAGFAGLVAITAALTTSTEEYKEQLDDLKSEYNEIVSEIQSVNSELETTIDRMKELEGKDSLTFTEKEEYDNLVKTNNELQRKIDLLQLEEKQKNKEKNKTFVDTMVSDTENPFEHEVNPDGKKPAGQYSISDEYLTSETGYIEAQFEIRDQLLEDLTNAETEKEKERIQKRIDEIEKYLNDKNDEWKNVSDGISYIENPTTEDDKAVNEWLDYIADFQDRMAIAMGGDNAKTNTFNRVVDNWQFDGTVQGLQDLGKEGKVTAEMLDDPKYDEFINKLVFLGVIDSANNLEDVALAFNSVATSAEDATNSASQYGDETDDLLASKLLGSKEALETFTTSVNSAYDAYSKLMNPNVSSSDILSSVMELSELANTMGKTLDWEMIDGFDDPLKQLGSSIEYISEEYAKSVLSGAGIDVNSEFGQMLANNIIQAQKAKIEFESLNGQIDNLQSSYQTLTDVLESYSETGYLTFDNLQSLLTADETLIKMLKVENGQLVINEEAYKRLASAQLIEFNSKLAAAAASEIEELAKANSKTATEDNAQASEDAVEKLDKETQAINRNTTAALSNAIAKAENSGVEDDDIQGILDKYNDIWNATIDGFNTDFSGFMGKSASKAGKDSGDAYLDAFEEELKHLQTLRDRGIIDESEYLERLRALYTKYFADREEYLDEFRKYEKEYLDGMKSLYDSALSGISKLMDNQIDDYNEAKEAAVTALEEERDARLEVIEAQKEQLQAQIDLIDEQIEAKQDVIDGIQDEIDAMNEANEERKRQLDLQKAQYELEKMKNQKSQLVYQDGQMVYSVDESGLADARQNVRDAELEIEIAKKEKEISLIEDAIELLEEQKDAIDEQIDALDKQVDSIEKYYSKMISEQEKYYDSLVKNMEKQKSKWEEIAEIQEIAEAHSAIEQVFGDLGYTVEDVLNGSTGAFEDFKAKYIAIMSDMGQNTSFQNGLAYASGVAKENFGSIINSSNEVKDALTEIGGSSTDLQPVAEAMDELGNSSSTASISTNAVASDMETLNTNTEGLDTKLSNISDSLTNLPASEGLNGWIEGFTNLGIAIKGVADALGITEEGTVGSLSKALESISQLTLGEDETGIIGQFSALKTAVDGVTSAISGGGDSTNSQSGDPSTSSSPSMSVGATGESASGLIGAINNIQTKATEILGSEGGEEEGSGVIGQFGQLKSAVEMVNNAIGIGENTEGSTLIGALQAQYEKAKDTIPEVKTLFEDLLASIQACVNALNSMVGAQDGFSGLTSQSGDGSTTPTPLASGTVGKAFANGYNGLPHNEKNALRSEYGQPELTVYPDGTTELTTTPTMSDLPRGTVVFNGEQTKRIMNNKGTILGNAYASGTLDNTSLPTHLRPLQEGDSGYALMKSFEIYQDMLKTQIIPPINSIDNNMDMFARNISNISNNNTSPTYVLNGGVNVTCPNVTDAEIAKRIGGEIEKAFFGMSNYANQRASITR